MRMGSATWSEYFWMIDLSLKVESSSSSPSRKCSVMVVPRCLRSMVSTAKSPSPSLSQRTPSEAGRPARRVSTVMRSATIKPE